jgi:hypothetical protein
LARQVDFVDINSGCPIDGVCNKGGGCQLMENRHGRHSASWLVGAACGPTAQSQRIEAPLPQSRFVGRQSARPKPRARRMQQIVEGMSSVLACPLTVKIRVPIAARHTRLRMRYGCRSVQQSESKGCRANAARHAATWSLQIGQSESKAAAHSLIPKLSQWGAAAVTLHGRTRNQRCR